MRNVLALETQDDMRDLNEFAECKYDDIPQQWPTTGSFEAVLTPRI
jgi:ferritin-like protein